MHTDQPAATVRLYRLRRGQLCTLDVTPEHADAILALEATMGLTAGWSRESPENPHIPADLKARFTAALAAAEAAAEAASDSPSTSTTLPGDSVPAPSARRPRKSRR